MAEMVDDRVDHLRLVNLGLGVDVSLQIHSNRDSESSVAKMIVAALSCDVSLVRFEVLEGCFGVIGRTYLYHR